MTESKAVRVAQVRAVMRLPVPMTRYQTPGDDWLPAPEQLGTASAVARTVVPVMRLGPGVTSVAVVHGSLTGTGGVQATTVNGADCPVLERPRSSRMVKGKEKVPVGMPACTVKSTPKTRSLAKPSQCKPSSKSCTLEGP